MAVFACIAAGACTGRCVRRCVSMDVMYMQASVGMCPWIFISAWPWECEGVCMSVHRSKWVSESLYAYSYICTPVSLSLHMCVCERQNCHVAENRGSGVTEKAYLSYFLPSGDLR